MAAHVQVSTTAGSREDAAGLARDAVQARVAACAQVVGPITSTYWWEGEVREEQEWLCLFKTPATSYRDLEELILGRHPYDTPEVIATPITHGSRDYLAWMDRVTL